MNIPEVRLIMVDDAYAFTVIKGPHGWYGAPGLRKGKYLTDAEVDGMIDAIPLVPGPSAVVDISYDLAAKFGDNTYDVDINGHAGARKASVYIAGAFIVTAALQKEGEPVMVRATKKPAPVAAPPKPALAIVRDGG